MKPYKQSIFILILCICMILTASVSAFDGIHPTYTPNYFFTGASYLPISSLDYNGKVFTGVRSNKLITSTDLENWTVHSDLPDVDMTACLNGISLAFGKGVTLSSSDGIHWEQTANTLPGAVKNSYTSARNSKAVIAFIEEYENDTLTISGNYASTDGIHWTKIEHIPEGAPIRVVNDLFVMESTEYMEGIYISSDGFRFERLSLTNCHDLAYWDNTYYALEFLNDASYNQIWSSTNLTDWTLTPIDYGYVYPMNSIFFEIDGVNQAFNLNGQNLVWKNGIWQPGENGVPENGKPNPPYVYYTTTEYGLLMWSTDRQLIFLENLTNRHIFDYNNITLSDLFVLDDVFYVISFHSYLPDTASYEEAVWESHDGQAWTKSTKSYDELYAAYRSESRTVSNGTARMTSDIIIRGSYVPDGSPVLTGHLTKADGTKATVAYENAYGNSLDVSAGNGFFFMSPEWYGDSYISPDGIARYPFESVVANSNSILRFDAQAGILYVADSTQITPSAFDPAVTVILNGEYLSFLTPPVIEQGRTLIPARFLFERAGADVWWDGETRTVTITYGSTTVTLTIDSDTASVNETTYTLDAPAQIINDKTLIPLRFISEALGFSVQWDEASQTAIVTTNLQ